MYALAAWAALNIAGQTSDKIGKTCMYIHIVKINALPVIARVIGSKSKSKTVVAAAAKATKRRFERGEGRHVSGSVKCSPTWCAINVIWLLAPVQ